MEGVGSFAVSCRDGLTLLNCVSENLPNISADPLRSFWPENSSCQCHDNFGMKCIAWCTEWQIPGIEHHTMKVNCNNTNVNCTRRDWEYCSFLSYAIKCYFKGNSIGSRQLEDKRFCYTYTNIVEYTGLDGDEFVVTCIRPSEDYKIDYNSIDIYDNTTSHVSCLYNQGYVLVCRKRINYFLSNYVKILNETTCECFGDEVTNYSCEATCIKKTIYF